jgi:hypothetical protein
MRFIQPAIEHQRRRQLDEADNGALFGGVAGNRFGCDRRGQDLRFRVDSQRQENGEQ